MGASRIDRLGYLEIRRIEIIFTSYANERE